MSEEIRLPDELKRVEARLAALRPASSRIDRDQLMYRAGWEAALVQMQRGVAAPHALSSPKPSRRGAEWGRTLGTAAAAAAIAVGGMWFFGPRRADAPLADSQESVAGVAGGDGAHAVMPQEAIRNSPRPRPHGRGIAPRRFSYANAPLLAMREQVLASDAREIFVALRPALGGPVAPPLSNWQLRAEILPQGEGAKASDAMRLLNWLNFSTREGDAI